MDLIMVERIPLIIVLKAPDTIGKWQLLKIIVSIKTYWGMSFETSHTQLASGLGISASVFKSSETTSNPQKPESESDGFISQSQNMHAVEVKATDTRGSAGTH